MEFRRPLGLALAGGGALGSWQTAAVRALARGGLVFDTVLGVSAGAITGTSYCLDRMDEALDKWRHAGQARLLRLSPRLAPLTLCAAKPLWDWVGSPVDEDAARGQARCRLVVVSTCLKDDKPVYAVFEPGGPRWDGPLARHLVASCSVPMVFPPVKVSYRGRLLTLVDGGVPTAERLTFSELAHCRDVVVIEMQSLEDHKKKRRGWLHRLNEGRKKGRNLIAEGIESLRGLASAPRLFHLRPSQSLDFAVLNLKQAHIERYLERGEQDALAFLEQPLAHLL